MDLTQILSNNLWILLFILICTIFWSYTPYITYYQALSLSLITTIPFLIPILIIVNHFKLNQYVGLLVGLFMYFVILYLWVQYQSIQNLDQTLYGSTYQQEDNSPNQTPIGYTVINNQLLENIN